MTTRTSPFLTKWCFRTSLSVSVCYRNQLISWNVCFTKRTSGRIMINTNASFSWFTHIETNTPTNNHWASTSSCNPHLTGTQLASQNVANIMNVINPTTMTILASLILPSRFFSLLVSAFMVVQDQVYHRL